MDRTIAGWLIGQSESMGSFAGGFSASASAARRPIIPTDCEQFSTASAPLSEDTVRSGFIGRSAPSPTGILHNGGFSDKPQATDRRDLPDRSRRRKASIDR